VMVTLFSEDAIPLAAWMFIKAFPVRWATAELDGSSDKILIDTLELAYTRMQALRI
jgi:phage tail-like protein